MTPPPRRRQAFRPDPPVARLIGFKLTGASEGVAEVRLNLGARHRGPSGRVHGGILCDLADAAMGAAFASTLRPRQSAVTVELKINFLRPVWRERLMAWARVVHRGRRLGVVDCEVSDEKGRLIAKASSTCMILRACFATSSRGLRAKREGREISLLKTRFLGLRPRNDVGA